MGPRAGLDGQNMSSPPGFDPGPSNPQSVAILTELTDPHIIYIYIYTELPGPHIYIYIYIYIDRRSRSLFTIKCMARTKNIKIRLDNSGEDLSVGFQTLFHRI